LPAGEENTLMTARTNLIVATLLSSIAAGATTFFGQSAATDGRGLRVFGIDSGVELHAVATIEFGEALLEARRSSQDTKVVPLTEPATVETEAVMFNRAAEAIDAQQKLRLAEAFLSSFPQSRYTDAARYLRFIGLRDTGDDSAALAAAEAVLARNPTREDVLFYAAHRYYTEKRELTKVVEYCYTVIAILEVRTKPESVAEAQWIDQRDSALFQAHWLMGAAQMLREDWGKADRSLRSALAMTKAGGSSIPAVVSSLAWTNYQMKRIPETIRLYEQCSTAAGYAAACKQSAAYIKNEYALQ
jgi:tetratricopeptide (TPR) repeat protein